ncbi:EpsG family protein [Lactovum odontotermitis]
MVYAGSIFLSLVLFGFASKILKKGVLFHFFSLLALLPPVIVAGIRDLTVGVDLTSYVIPHLGFAGTFSNYVDFNNFMYSFSTYYFSMFGAVYHTEFGYNCLVFFVSRFTSDPHWLMFVIQLLISYFVFVSAKKISKKYQVSVTSCMFIYYTGFYIIGINLMRQSISMSLLLLAIVYLLEKNYIGYFIFQFFAYSFHTIALMGVLIFLIVFIIRRKPNVNYSLLLFFATFLTVFSLAFGRVTFSLLYSIASYMPFLSTHLGSFSGGGGSNVILRRMLVYLIFGFSFLFTLYLSRDHKSLYAQTEDGMIQLLSLSAVLTAISLPILSTVTYQSTIFRTGFVLEFILIIAMPLTLKLFPVSERKTIRFIGGLLGVIVFCYFLYSRYADTSPYTSQILENFLR